MTKYLEAGDIACIISLGVGNTEQSGLTPLFNWWRSHTNLSFSSFSSFVTKPAGDIQAADSLAAAAASRRV